MIRLIGPVFISFFRLISICIISKLSGNALAQVSFARRGFCQPGCIGHFDVFMTHGIRDACGIHPVCSHCIGYGSAVIPLGYFGHPVLVIVSVRHRVSVSVCLGCLISLVIIGCLIDNGLLRINGNILTRNHRILDGMCLFPVFVIQV